MADDFEARHMQDGATVLHRDKRVSRGLALALLIPGLLTVALGAYIGVANATASKPVPAAALPLVVLGVVALGLFLMLLGVMFSVVRTLVTARAVHVKFGLWGPDIPLASIERAAVVRYDWVQFGGWGIKRNLQGTWAYVPSGDRAVELVYREGGAERRVLVGVEDPAELVRKIAEAQQGTARVRVDAGPTEDEALADDEATREADEPAPGGRARGG